MSEGFKFYGVDGTGLPVVLLTQNACRPDSRFLPFAERNYYRLKQKHRCGLLIPTQAKQFACSRGEKKLKMPWKKTAMAEIQLFCLFIFFHRLLF